MSIWASTAVIGDGCDADDDMRPGVVLDLPNPSRYPDPQTNVTTTLDLAVIPRECVPGHEDEPNYDASVGPWLRIGIPSGDVALDMTAVYSLWVELGALIARTKVDPSGDKMEPDGSLTNPYPTPPMMGGGWTQCATEPEWHRNPIAYPAHLVTAHMADFTTADYNAICAAEIEGEQP